MHRERQGAVTVVLPLVYDESQLSAADMAAKLRRVVIARFKAPEEISTPAWPWKTSPHNRESRDSMKAIENRTGFDVVADCSIEILAVRITERDLISPAVVNVANLVQQLSLLDRDDRSDH